MISTLNIKKYIQIIILSLLILALPVNAKTNNKNLVNIYFFHSNNCSHCNNEIKFLDSLEKKYNNIKVYRYEIHESTNNENRINIQKIYNIKSNGVPLTIIGDTPYIGYSENLSNTKFIKTIEYYSRYGYEDKAGALLMVDNLPTIDDLPVYEINKNNPTLKEFMEEYGNYKLIGSLYTDDLDITSNSIILGILSQFNLIKIISIVIVLILLTRIKDKKTKLIFLSWYLIISFILNTVYIIPNYVYKSITIGIILILFINGIVKTIKNKKQKYLYNSLFIIISILSTYLIDYFYPINRQAFNEIIALHNLNGLNKISYYANYIFIIVIINILFILIYSSVNTKSNIINKKGNTNRHVKKKNTKR